MKIDKRLLVLAAAGLLLTVLGIFGPSGFMQNRKKSENIAEMESRIRDKYGEEARESASAIIEQMDYASVQKEKEENAPAEFLSGKTTVFRTVLASGISLIAFSAFLIIAGRPRKKDDSENEDDMTETESERSDDKCPLLDVSNKKELAKLAKILKNNGIAIVPCDTIYGICAKANSENRQRIFDIKKRDQSKNLITLCSKDAARSMLGDRCPKTVFDIWPAPLSVVAKDENGASICIRVPKSPIIDRITQSAGPIYSTSVNISGEPELNSLDEIKSQFSDSVDAIGYASNWAPDSSSTIIDVTSYPFQILRTGAMSKNEIIERFKKDGFTVS